MLQRAKPAKKNSQSKVIGPVAFVGSLLIASALLRVFTSASEVLAQTGESQNIQMASAELQPEPTLVASDANMQRLLDALLAREQAVAEKERELAAEAKRLEEQDMKVTARLEELEVAEQSLKDTMALADEASEQDLERLTKVYEKMKPKKAAALFETMRPDFAAGFLGRMKSDAAAGIMAAMTPEKAYSISAILAGRNANAGNVPARN